MPILPSVFWECCAGATLGKAPSNAKIVKQRDSIPRDYTKHGRLLAQWQKGCNLPGRIGKVLVSPETGKVGISTPSPV